MVRPPRRRCPICKQSQNTRVDGTMERHKFAPGMSCPGHGMAHIPPELDTTPDHRDRITATDVEVQLAILARRQERSGEAAGDRARAARLHDIHASATAGTQRERKRA